MIILCFKGLENNIVNDCLFTPLPLPQPGDFTYQYQMETGNRYLKWKTLIGTLTTRH